MALKKLVQRLPSLNIITNPEHTKSIPEVDQPHTQTKSTTEILVQSSGEVLIESSAASANSEDAGEHFSHPHAQENAHAVLRQEKPTPTAMAEQAKQVEPTAKILRTEGTPAASSVVAKEAKLKEIRLSVSSRGHRIPTTSLPHVKNAGTATTTAAESVVDPESIGWKHGLVPGVLARLQVEEGNIIKVCIFVLSMIAVLGVYACCFLPRVAKEAENPEVTSCNELLKKRKTLMGSMFHGLAAVDFVDGEDKNVRAMLKQIWDARKSGKETPTPDTIATAPQPENPALFNLEDIRRQMDANKC